MYGGPICTRPDGHLPPWATRFPCNALARHARNWTGFPDCRGQRLQEAGHVVGPPRRWPLRGEGRCRRMLLLSTTVNYIRARFADLRAREDGVTAVEYALMVAIIALLMVAGFFLLFENVSTAFTDTGACVTNVSTASSGC